MEHTFKFLTDHKYNDDDISQFYTRIYNECPKLLELKKL